MVIFDQQYMWVMIFIILCFAGLMVMFYFMLRSIDDLKRDVRNERTELTQVLHGIEKRLAQQLIHQHEDSKAAMRMAVAQEMAKVDIVSPLVSPATTIAGTAVVSAADGADAFFADHHAGDGTPAGHSAAREPAVQEDMMHQAGSNSDVFAEDISAYTEAAEFDDGVDNDVQLAEDREYVTLYGFDNGTDNASIETAMFEEAVSAPDELDGSDSGNSWDLDSMDVSAPLLDEQSDAEDVDVRSDRNKAVDDIAYSVQDSISVALLPEVALTAPDRTQKTAGPDCGDTHPITQAQLFQAAPSAEREDGTSYKAEDMSRGLEKIFISVESGELAELGESAELAEPVEPVELVELADPDDSGDFLLGEEIVLTDYSDEYASEFADHHVMEREEIGSESALAVSRSAAFETEHVDPDNFADGSLADLTENSLGDSTGDSIVESAPGSPVSTSSNVTLPDLYMGRRESALKEDGLFLFASEDSATSGPESNFEPDFVIDSGVLPDLGSSDLKRGKVSEVAATPAKGITIAKEDNYLHLSDDPQTFSGQEDEDEEGVIILTSNEIVYDEDTDDNGTLSDTAGDTDGTEEENVYVFSGKSDADAFAGWGDLDGYDDSEATSGDAPEPKPSAEGLDDPIDMDSALAKALATFGISEDDAADGNRYLYDAAQAEMASSDSQEVLLTEADIAEADNFASEPVEPLEPVALKRAENTVSAEDTMDVDSDTLEFLWEDDTVPADTEDFLLEGNNFIAKISGNGEDDFAFSDSSDDETEDSPLSVSPAVSASGDTQRYVDSEKRTADEGQAILPGFFEGEDPVDLSVSSLDNSLDGHAAGAGTKDETTSDKHDNIMEYIVPE